MVKKCIIQREIKRFKLNLKYSNKLKYLKNIIKDKNFSLLDRYNAIMKIQKIPRNSNIVRKRNRCSITGRGRGYFRFFGLSRFLIRNLSFNSYIPGIFKSSW